MSRSPNLDNPLAVPHPVAVHWNGAKYYYIAFDHVVLEDQGNIYHEYKYFSNIKTPNTDELFFRYQYDGTREEEIPFSASCHKAQDTNLFFVEVLDLLKADVTGVPTNRIQLNDIDSPPFRCPRIWLHQTRDVLPDSFEC